MSLQMPIQDAVVHTAKKVGMGQEQLFWEIVRYAIQCSSAHGRIQQLVELFDFDGFARRIYSRPPNLQRPAVPGWLLNLRSLIQYGLRCVRVFEAGEMKMIQLVGRGLERRATVNPNTKRRVKVF